MIQSVLGALRLAIVALSRNKTRGILTILGILIGTAAVVTITALAEGASSRVAGEIDGFGANLLMISPQAVQASGARSKVTGRLTEADGKAIVRDAISVSHVAPWLSTSGQVIYGEKNVQTFLMGTTTPYFFIRKFKIARGELWNESDETLKTKVCVIGGTVAANLFGSEDPIGRTIRIGRAPYRVIGLMESRGSSTFGEDQDDRILMPIGSYRAHVLHTAPGRVDMLMASATSELTTTRAEQQIASILRQRHRIATDRDPDFVINTQAEFRQTQEQISKALSALLLSVAAVSLLVGGIGVMNIMLVSVAERTREIGIRMSIGARQFDIMTQFLVEAIVLSVLGGLMGILIGTSAVVGFGRLLSWQMSPTLSALGVAAGTSVAIGVIFGYLPARRAARLDPIVALRSE